MKFERQDNVCLEYKSKKTFVAEVMEFGRGGTKSDQLNVYVLENGVRILPAHFRYGLVKIPDGVGWFQWHLKAFYPASLMRTVIRQDAVFFSKIPADDGYLWSGGIIAIPIKE